MPVRALNDKCVASKSIYLKPKKVKFDNLITLCNYEVNSIFPIKTYKDHFIQHCQKLQISLQFTLKKKHEISWLRLQNEF